MTLKLTLDRALNRPLRRTQPQGEILFAKAKLILPELNQDPPLQMLTKLLLLAQRNLTRSIELSWTSPMSQISYALDVCCVRKEFIDQQLTGDFLEVRWRLSQKSGKQIMPVWAHATADVDVIIKLLWFGVNPAASTGVDSIVKNDRSVQDDLVNFESPPLELHRYADQQKGSRARAAALTLAGQVGEIEIDSLLQLIAICKFSGRLDFVDNLQYNLVFFENGNPVHASMETTLTTEFSPIVTGEAAIVDLLLWQSGRFEFNMGQTTCERTIKRRLEVLLLESACLKDAHSSLENSGINSDSILCPLLQPSSEEQFKSVVNTGSRIAVVPQKQFFDLADSRRTVRDIGLTLGWHRVNYIPIVHNLYKTGLVGV